TQYSAATQFGGVTERATTTTSLDAEQDRGIISKTQFTATLNEPSSIGTSSCSEPRHQETIGDVAAQTRSKRVSKFSNDPALSRVNTLRSGEDRLKLFELMELYTQLQSRFLALETTKNNQALGIIGSSRRFESSDEASLGDQEDAFKQGRIIDNLNADERVTLVDETQGRIDQDMFNTGLLNDEEVVAKNKVSIADPVVVVVTTIGVEVSTAATTPTISMDDITLAKALAALKSAKPMVKEPSVSKAKRIVMQEPKETTIRTTTIVPSQGSKDKGKAKMIEPEKPLKKKDQIMIDEDVARNLEAQLQAELEEEDRLARQREEESKIWLTYSVH
nr:hypothetical protein [Tanacetum cinerariifolium]